MRRDRLTIVILLFAAACSPETPAPPAQPEPATAPVAVTADPSAVSTAAGTPVVLPSERPTYDDAMNWFRSNEGFRFTLDEGGVHAEGTMKRERVGAESVTFRAGGEEWRATAGPNGVAWDRRSGSSWTPTTAPAFGNRVYQRVTLAFDPQKKEGSAQVVDDGTAGLKHFRFTDANSGNVHDLWVRPDGRVERIRIGSDFEMRIE